MTTCNSFALPHFYRQRLLLALIKEFGGNMKKTVLHKRLFLFMEKEERKEYEFVPYKFGCWSMNCENDLESLSQSGWLKIDDTIQMANVDIPLNLVKRTDSEKLRSFADETGHWDYEKLIRHVYTEYPYYAVNSEIAEKNLSKQEMDIVRENRPIRRGKVLYTIGYEGISFEQYTNRLIKNDVRLLCDVRKNPLSRKAGFSKGTLKAILPKIGIKYIHVPELGIDGGMRRNLNNLNDYKQLFSKYACNLSEQKSSLSLVSGMIEKHKRIALTCFESNPQMCHRSCIGNYMAEVNPQLKVEHI